MSGFFSLGGAFGVGKEEDHQNDPNQTQHQHQNQEDSINTPNSLYLFKNEEIYTKGFELWQQYYQLHQHRHQHQQHHLLTPHYDLGVSRRRTSPVLDELCLNSTNYNNSISNSISNSNSNSNSNLYGSSWRMMRQSGYGIAGGEHGGSSGSSGGVNCQDCGNQAKKDCQHMRCRTCCKSRGFQCPTHVKSTWVPAAKRRERQQQLASLTQHQQQQQNDHLGNQQLSLVMRGSGSGSGIDQNPKRLREDHNQLIATAGGGGAVVVNLPATHHTHHQNVSSALEMGHFPAEVSSPAVFRCVRVSALDEAEEQLAYQTAVSIGGHVFKGILYDHGVEGRYSHPDGGESSSAPGDDTGPQHQLNLITSGTMGAATATVNPNVASIDPSTIYPTPLNAFMAGTQFFPPPRS